MNQEINLIKGYSRFSLERSAVIGKNITSAVLSDVRTSQNTWLDDNDQDEKLRHKLKIIMDRVPRITRLNVHGKNNSEALQVANYGIGGHYSPHVDYFPEDPNRKKLNDVKRGGATVFPRIDAAVWPRKGSAAFWYNIRKNGTKDPMTLHGGCPVLHGTKWIGNK
uniref:Fe2OG dioxygenase domain-containing protein n=1 Tax=Strigamia maritima TaxID=126957 RepID=T1IJJ1_STRMM